MKPRDAWPARGAPPQHARPARRACCMRPISLLHAFARGGKHLFALQGMLGCARKPSASRRSLSARRTAILTCQGTLLIAHIAQTPGATS